MTSSWQISVGTVVLETSDASLVNVPVSSVMMEDRRREERRMGEHGGDWELCARVWRRGGRSGER